MSDSLDEARVRILVENTAQAVFKHLERLEDAREKLGARWVWELLQNARDVALPAGVSVQIEASSDELLFRHDGRSFTEDELAHLIYHGSTKVAENESDLIHFGSGFLSTHLLSRHVTVRGCLVRADEPQSFRFVLDRSGGSVESLNESMQRTWDQFRGSLRTTDDGPTEQGTSYSYALDDRGRALADAGLAQLKSFVALALAFSPEIRAVSVRTPTESWEVRRGKPTDRDGITLQRFDVVFQDDDDAARYVALAGDETIQAAVPLRATDGAFAIDLTSTTTRLFVVFPLATTERLALPTIIHSKQLAPLEDRDGLPLDGDSDRSAGNRRVIERSATFSRRLIQRAAVEGWDGAAELLRFDTSALPDWAPTEWVREQLRGHVDFVRREPLLVTSTGERIAPHDALIPTAPREETREELWSLAAFRTDARSRLPAREHLHAWAASLSSWRSLMGDDAKFPEVLDARGLALFAAEQGTVPALSERLDGIGAVDWLVRLCELAFEGAQDLFDSHSFLPSEAGNLHKRSELEVDGGIDELLKTISAALGVDLRDRLLDPRIATGVKADLFARLTEAKAVEDLLAHHAALGREGSFPALHVEASAALFRWLVNSTDHRARVDGLQVSSSEPDNGGFTIITLERQADHPPLAPPALWREGARPYAELFPRRRMLHPAIAEGDEADWEWLGLSGFVALDPIVRRRRRLNVFVSSDGVVESDDDEEAHRAVEAIELSDICFLEEQDVGLIDTARRSSVKAIDLVRFVVFYAASEDVTAFDEVTIECECGQSHAALQAGWLVPLRRRKWIPARDGTRRSLNVNGESLADLVRESPETVAALATEIGDKVLRAWGVSSSDLQLRVVAADEGTRKSLVLAVGDLARASGSVERLQALSQEIVAHPEIILQIEFQREQRERVERNAHIGQVVEALLQEALSAEGFTVTRTGVGSDFEVESDIVADHQEVLIEVAGKGESTLIEVKSTRRSYARMTPRQAETATTNQDRFCLCVVELSDDDDPTPEAVRDGSRFVFDIGNRLVSAWADYTTYQTATSNVRRPQGEIGVEIDEGQVRFRVEQEVWRHALEFPAAVGWFRTR